MNWKLGFCFRYKKYSAVLKSEKLVEQPKMKDTDLLSCLTTVHRCLFLRPQHGGIHEEIYEIYNPKTKEAICGATVVVMLETATFCFFS